MVSYQQITLTAEAMLQKKRLAAKELLVFLFVGFTSVAIDFLVYHLALLMGIEYDVGKSIGFIVGATFAYFANKFWTFGHVNVSYGSHFRFILVYACNLGANVSINRLALEFLPFEVNKVTIAFILATGVSAALNFLGMKFFVFTKSEMTSDTK